jgi:hypothetical protein
LLSLQSLQRLLLPCQLRQSLQRQRQSLRRRRHLLRWLLRPQLPLLHQR